MRLFVLPISSRQNLIYCQRLNLQLSQRAPTYLDRVSTKATTTWLNWERKKTGWQKQITKYGNKLFQRLPHEEYGLKSIPPLNERRKSEEIARGGDVEVEYPSGLIEDFRVQQILRELGSDEKQAFHTKWLFGSLIGMPLVAPFALVPVIPNLPFFYLCFRAWSHWRARAGSKHLGFLLQKQRVKPRPSTILRFAYAEAALYRTIRQIYDEALEMRAGNLVIVEKPVPEEHMLLSRYSGATIAEGLDIPEIQMEIERAVWQVEKSIIRRASIGGHQ